MHQLISEAANEAYEAKTQVGFYSLRENRKRNRRSLHFATLRSG